MSVRPQAISPIPEETARVARAILPKGNTFIHMRDEFGIFFRDEDFLDLFSEKGQPAESAWRLALVMVMQYAEGLTALETGMYLIGCTYNFCFAHHELSKTQHLGYACTPAMAAGVTDHLWSIQEVLTYKIAPAPWIEPKRPRRSRKKTGAEVMLPKRPRGRPRKHPLPDPTLPKRPRGRPRMLA